MLCGAKRFQRRPEHHRRRYDRIMNVNARGLFLTTRAFVQSMIDQKSGRIINISSISS